MKTYPVLQVRQMCELCYGKPISDRTWRKWRQALGMGCKEHQTKELTERQAIWIAGYAYLKHQKPNHKHTLSDVVNFLQKHPKVEQMIWDIPKVNEGFYGRNLPEVIERLIGRKISLRTLYRIAKNKNINFSINSIYQLNMISIFLEGID